MLKVSPKVVDFSETGGRAVAGCHVVIHIYFTLVPTCHHLVSTFFASMGALGVIYSVRCNQKQRVKMIFLLPGGPKIVRLGATQSPTPEVCRSLVSGGWRSRRVGEGSFCRRCEGTSSSSKMNHQLHISNRFARKVRKPVGNGSPRKNLKSGRRFTFFGSFSEMREDTLESHMVNLV